MADHRTVFPGTLTVEQIYQDRDQFAGLVREVAAPDVGRMGIEILSFTIKVSSLFLVVVEMCIALKDSKTKQISGNNVISKMLVVCWQCAKETMQVR